MLGHCCGPGVLQTVHLFVTHALNCPLECCLQLAWDIVMNVTYITVFDYFVFT